MPIQQADPRRGSMVLLHPSRFFVDEVLTQRFQKFERAQEVLALAVVARDGNPSDAMVRLVMAMAIGGAAGDLLGKAAWPEWVENGSRAALGTLPAPSRAALTSTAPLRGGRAWNPQAAIRAPTFATLPRARKTLGPRRGWTTPLARRRCVDLRANDLIYFHGFYFDVHMIAETNGILTKAAGRNLGRNSSAACGDAAPRTTAASAANWVRKRVDTAGVGDVIGNGIVTTMDGTGMRRLSTTDEREDEWNWQDIVVEPTTNNDGLPSEAKPLEAQLGRLDTPLTDIFVAEPPRGMTQLVHPPGESSSFGNWPLVRRATVVTESGPTIPITVTSEGMNATHGMMDSMLKRRTRLPRRMMRTIHLCASACGWRDRVLLKVSKEEREPVTEADTAAAGRRPPPTASATRRPTWR